MEKYYEEKYNEIYENIYNKNPNEYKSFQINYRKDIYDYSLQITEYFTDKKIMIENKYDKLIYDFFVRTLVIYITKNKISNSHINIILSNVKTNHKSIIVNAIDYYLDYNLIENQIRDRYIIDTKLGKIKFDVGYFKNKNINNQIIFNYKVAILFSENNYTICSILLNKLIQINNINCNNELNYLNSFKKININENNEEYNLISKEISAQIQTQYTILQLIANNIMINSEYM
jgi:hypothetical protein